MKSEVSPEPERKEVGAGVFDEVSPLKFNKISILYCLLKTKFILLSVLDHSGQGLVSLPQLVDVKRN